MTLKELSGYYDTLVLVKALKDEISHMETCARGLVANYNGISSGGGGKTDNVSAQAEKLIAHREKLSALLSRAEEERILIDRYIFEEVANDDKLIASMMYHRFIKLRTWYQVAYDVGGNNTADSCRMAVLRYVRSRKETE